MARRPFRRRRTEAQAKKDLKIDAYVGGQIKKRRGELGLSRTKLGDAMELTFQQIQKYERGSNRVGASRLYDLSTILGKPISYFFEDLEPKPGEAANSEDDELLRRRPVIELIRAYISIADQKTRYRISQLAKELRKADFN